MEANIDHQCQSEPQQKSRPKRQRYRNYYVMDDGDGSDGERSTASYKSFKKQKRSSTGGSQGSDFIEEANGSTDSGKDIEDNEGLKDEDNARLKPKKNTRARGQQSVKGAATRSKRVTQNDATKNSGAKVNKPNKKPTITQLKRERTDLRKVNRELEVRLAKAERDLSACQNDLWKLQPLPEISDDVIKRQFKVLCASISDCLLAEARHGEKQAGGNGVYDPFLISRDPRLSRAQHGMDDDIPSDLLAQYAIFKCVVDVIFKPKHLLIGVTDKTQRLLQQTHQSMGDLKPSRDLATINMWRSETLKALIHTDLFNTELDISKGLLAEKLQHMIRRRFPELFGKSDGLERLIEGVVVPSVEFAISIQTSVKSYRIKLPGEIAFVQKTVAQDILQCFGCVNKATRKLISGMKATEEGLRESHARAILAFEPALVRHYQDGPAEILQTGKILVQIDMKEQCAAQSEDIVHDMSSAQIVQSELEAERHKIEVETPEPAEPGKVSMQTKDIDRSIKKIQVTEEMPQPSSHSNSLIKAEQQKKKPVAAGIAAATVVRSGEQLSKSAPQDQSHLSNKTKSSSSWRTMGFRRIAPGLRQGNLDITPLPRAAERTSKFQSDTRMTGMEEDLMQDASDQLEGDNACHP